MSIACFQGTAGAFRLDLALPALALIYNLPSVVSCNPASQSNLPISSMHKGFSARVKMVCLALSAFLMFTFLPMSSAAEGLRQLTNEWIVSLDAVMDSSPALAPDGTIYFGDWNGSLWALNPD